MYQVLKAQYFVYLPPALIFIWHVIVYLYVSYGPQHYSGNYVQQKNMTKCPLPQGSECD